ncbi:hypothetical protein AB1Y20_011837 [Prymnesium parvum]|uniref:SEA domain-containing protein n=1 Tax=Prymnesium parvum TaxID=97485 RepID=A0AB34II55_PRYPA
MPIKSRAFSVRSLATRPRGHVKQRGPHHTTRDERTELRDTEDHVAPRDCKDSPPRAKRNNTAPPNVSAGGVEAGGIGLWSAEDEAVESDDEPAPATEESAHAAAEERGEAEESSAGTHVAPRDRPRLLPHMPLADAGAKLSARVGRKRRNAWAVLAALVATVALVVVLAVASAGGGAAPPPPPPPPPYAPGSGSLFEVEVGVVVDGSVADFDTAAYNSNLASAIGVAASSISTTVVAGSVLVTSRVTVQRDELDRTLSTVRVTFGSAEAASSSLGVRVNSIAQAPVVLVVPASRTAASVSSSAYPTPTVTATALSAAAIPAPLSAPTFASSSVTSASQPAASKPAAS